MAKNKDKPETPPEGATPPEQASDAAAERELLKEQNAVLLADIETLKGENADLQATVKKQGARLLDGEHAMTDLDKENSALKAENAELRKSPAAPPVTVQKPPEPGAMRRAKVRVPGTHFGELEVTFPADAPNPTLAAIEAAKAARGIVSFGAGPEVELLD